MGVKDLWQLVSPVGRRVSLESLEGKTLAIDARYFTLQLFLITLNLENFQHLDDSIYQGNA